MSHAIYRLPVALAAAAAFMLSACENPLAEQAQAARAVAASPLISVSSGDVSLAEGAALDFGLVSVGSSCEIEIRLANGGTQALRIDVAEMAAQMASGTESDSFRVLTFPAAEVAADEGTSFMVRFQPLSGGDKGATLTIPSNDVTTPSFSLSLGGSGWTVALTTSAVSNITTSTATGGGDITSDGGIDVTARGICWSTSPNPTVDDHSQLDAGVGTGSFSDFMTGLVPGYLYYVRAWASNGATTGYGSQVSFSTLPARPSLSSVTPVGYPAGAGKLAVSWQAAGGSGTFYDVYRDTGSTMPASPADGFANLTSTSCVLTGLNPFTPYYVWIVAKNATGAGAPSATMASPVSTGVHVQSVSVSPATLSLNALGDTGQLTVTVLPVDASDPTVVWSAGSGADVGADGTVTPTAAGSPAITATANDGGSTDSCVATIVPGIKTFVSGLTDPMGMSIDSDGNVYVADRSACAVWKLSPDGDSTIVAGNGSVSHAGDGGLATSASIAYPYGTAVDSAGNLYILEQYYNCVRKVSASTGIISTIAGIPYTTTGTYGGDGGQATSAYLNNPFGIALNAAGTALYIADGSNNRVRKVDLSTGIITTFAGTGTAGFSGDGGAATSAQLSCPESVAVDSAGAVYIADSSNRRIRRVSGGVITTIAGTGVSGTSGDGGPATSATMSAVSSLALDASGSVLYIADSYYNRVRKIEIGGDIEAFAGNGSTGYTGDFGPAVDATLGRIQTQYTFTAFWGIAFDPRGAGTLYIADLVNGCVRMVR